MLTGVTIVIFLLDATITFFFWVIGVGSGAWWYRAGLWAIGIHIVAAILAGWFLGSKEQEGWAPLVAILVVPVEVLSVKSPLFALLVGAG